MKPNPIALVIDNDKADRRWLRLLLESEHYRVYEADNGRAGVTSVPVCLPDIVILEPTLPDINGLALLTRLRAATHSGVLVLSESSQESDIVAALDSGACDYLVKPFSERELLARLRAIQRCLLSEAHEPVLSEAGLSVDLKRHLVTIEGRKIELTPIEEALLHSLMAHSGQVASSRYLLRSVWGAEGENRGQYLRVFMSILRKKLEPQKQVLAIETVDTRGYRLRLHGRQENKEPTLSH